MKSFSQKNDQIKQAALEEGQKFQECYEWLLHSMSDIFFKEVSREKVMLIVHSLMGFQVQDYFSTINLKHASIVLCLDSADADLKILNNYPHLGIKNYRTYVSSSPLNVMGVAQNLRIATIYFTEAVETVEIPFSPKDRENLKKLMLERNPDLSQEEFDRTIDGMDNRFLRSIPLDKLVLAIDMFFRAQTRDYCQYEVTYDDNNKGEGENGASMHIVLAWRNTPKYKFLYRIAQVVFRHKLVMKGVNAAYFNPYGQHNILIMVIGLTGCHGEDVWDVADIPDFLRELLTVKYFNQWDIIEKHLVNKGIIEGTMANMLRSLTTLIHQFLVPIDPNVYTLDLIEQDLCKHPELSIQLCDAFGYKFSPDSHDIEKFHHLTQALLSDLMKLDTGNEKIDLRRRNILQLAVNILIHTYKTNFYRYNYTSIIFRIDPKILEKLPFDYKEKFPEMPFAIFFIKGMHFFGFHIRFKDLSRGGLRTVVPERTERFLTDRDNVFQECYNLSYTQHKKNKEIPEGGSKGIIFLHPYEGLDAESEILRNELISTNIDPEEIESKVVLFREERKIEYMLQAQRSWVTSLITIINFDDEGKLKAKHIVDWWKKPEYIYLGPDENMPLSSIEWIAEFSKKYGYKPGSSFITSKPIFGINHKEYGVTSHGVHVYMLEVLRYLNINPLKEKFTLKMSGGPDGDVAGNQIFNLYKYLKDTALLLALTDASGTIYDPQGLDLDELARLFHLGAPIKYYSPTLLKKGGFLVDRFTQRSKSVYLQQTLCWKNEGDGALKTWLSASEANHLLRNNVHKTVADVFIPAGGRPRTLNENNIREFLTPMGSPTAKAIVEGANLYLTPGARTFLEDLGVLIIKDSSANKGGVISSSYEVLSGLAMGDQAFLEHKSALVKEVLDRIEELASKEARLLFLTHKETGLPLTEISDKISQKINQFTYQLLDYLDTIDFPKDLNDPLISTFYDYCLPVLQGFFREDLLKNIPDHHKKAIISCHLASELIYTKGIDWWPSIVDILLLVLTQIHSLNH